MRNKTPALIALTLVASNLSGCGFFTAAAQKDEAKKLAAQQATTTKDVALEKLGVVVSVPGDVTVTERGNGFYGTSTYELSGPASGFSMYVSDGTDSRFVSVHDWQGRLRAENGLYIQTIRTKEDKDEGFELEFVWPVRWTSTHSSGTREYQGAVVRRPIGTKTIHCGAAQLTPAQVTMLVDACKAARATTSG